MEKTHLHTFFLRKNRHGIRIFESNPLIHLVLAAKKPVVLEVKRMDLLVVAAGDFDGSGGLAGLDSDVEFEDGSFDAAVDQLLSPVPCDRPDWKLSFETSGDS